MIPVTSGNADIQQMDNIDDYNKWVGVETLNPLVSVIDFSKCNDIVKGLKRLGFYAVFLKDVHCGDLVYGRQTYDYQEGTLVFIAPGQVIGVIDDGTPFKPKGWGLLFHPDLLRGTSLAKEIHTYTFFSYKSNEALHLSEREREVAVECFRNILHELEHDIDKHSRRLITSNIELFLNYCVRFYDRQFITRVNVNKDALSRLEDIINDYYLSGKAAGEGLLTVAYCADALHLSPNYLGDMIKKETGLSPQMHIKNALINMAKDYLADPQLTVNEISYKLGFQYPQHFTRMFKKETGKSPKEYRDSFFTRN